jgi:hypothetical protein
MEQAVKEHLSEIRPDLFIEQSQSASAFLQYAHLAVFRDFRRQHIGGQTPLARIESAVSRLKDPDEQRLLEREITQAIKAIDLKEELIDRLKAQMPEESLLNIDIAIAEAIAPTRPRLHMALSSKWSLRTDRAQDCVSQGSKLVALRRGRMPHFAVVTMEPRPAMLKILGDGSGSVDYVYHLDLPALKAAVGDLRQSKRSPGKWSPALTFERLIGQGRLRDYDDLVQELMRQPQTPL